MEDVSNFADYSNKLKEFVNSPEKTFLPKTIWNYLNNKVPVNSREMRVLPKTIWNSNSVVQMVRFTSSEPSAQH